MTKDELIERLRTECHSGDIEADHVNADDLLIEYINDYEVKQAYDEVEKWYA